MADTTLKDRDLATVPDTASPLVKGSDDGGKGAKPTKKAAGNDVPILFRVLIGGSGLAMLVGFFLPWVQDTPASADAVATFSSGLELLMQTDVAGTPPVAVIVVPVLGTALAAIAFTGFRYTAYVALTVSLLLFGYAAYVLFHIFMQLTGVGLWVTTGAAFSAMLLGAGTLLWMRRAADKARAKQDKAASED